jgi:PAS domain S-box-containing protein
VDLTRKVLYWNHRAEQITGFLSQEVVGRYCAHGVLAHCSINGNACCQSENCPLMQVIRERQATESRLLLRHKQGHRVPVLVRALPLRDEKGRVAAIAEVFQEESAGPAGLRWMTENIDRFDVDVGLPSTLATRAQLQFDLAQKEPEHAIFIIEIMNLRQMSIDRGKEMANSALRTMAHSISKVMTLPHYMGCWSGARLLLVANCNDELTEKLRENLENTGSSCGITWWGERIAWRVKVKAFRPDAYESVEELMKALEEAPTGEQRKCS